NVLTKTVKVTGGGSPTYFVTTYTYDNAYRQTQMIEDAGTSHLNIETDRYYDTLHRLTTLRAVNGAQNQDTVYTYDDENHVLTEAYPDSGVVSYTYDLDGKLTQKTDQKGQVTTFEYNNRDLLTTKVYDYNGANEGTQTFTHDALRRMTGNTDDNSGNKSVVAGFSYDVLSRMTQESLNIGGGTTRYVSKTYDAFGQITSRTQPSGREVDYTWTTLHQPHEIQTDVGSGMATVADYAYLYDSGNDKRPLLATKTLHSGTGVALNVAYDSVGRSTTYNWLKNSTSQVGFENTYDLAGNRTATTHLHKTNGSEDETFQYDTALRLTSYVRNPTAQDPFDQTFNLDKVANWTSFVEEGTTEYRTHSIANELTARDSTSLTHDANGSQTSDGTLTYLWDANNRMTKVLNGQTAVAEYYYDAADRRVAKYVDATSTETRFYLSGWREIEERDGSDNLVREYVFGGQYVDEVVLKKEASGGAIHYYLHDPRYSVYGLCDTSGAMAERYRYTAYGKVTFLSGDGQTVLNSSAVGNAILYAGRRLDSETGLYYFRHRMYSGEQGRFVSRDPATGNIQNDFGMPEAGEGYYDGMNLYAGYFAPCGIDPIGLGDLGPFGPQRGVGGYKIGEGLERLEGIERAQKVKGVEKIRSIQKSVSRGLREAKDLAQDYVENERGSARVGSLSEVSSATKVGGTVLLGLLVSNYVVSNYGDMLGLGDNEPVWKYVRKGPMECSPPLVLVAVEKVSELSYTRADVYGPIWGVGGSYSAVYWHLKRRTVTFACCCPDQDKDSPPKLEQRFKPENVSWGGGLLTWAVGMTYDIKETITHPCYK
ncbi:MAG: RHS repeat-associated core domain-containing protein, partial [Planctomycetota bacterium]